jgi:hypothetical protein
MLSTENTAALAEIADGKIPESQQTIGRVGMWSKIRGWIIEKLKK